MCALSNLRIRFYVSDMEIIRVAGNAKGAFDQVLITRKQMPKSPHVSAFELHKPPQIERRLRIPLQLSNSTPHIELFQLIHRSVEIKLFM